MVAIRDERATDAAVVHNLHAAAFARPAEAELVAALRRDGRVRLALVAEVGGAVVGHILFSPVTIAGAPGGLGLGPMAVLPAHQRRGVGSALVRAGLARCLGIGEPVVVVVGHPEFYPRFGFVPAAARGLRCEYPVPDEAFMVNELRPGALAGRAGLVRYDPHFGAV
jgi:putative acetyltransferase